VSLPLQARSLLALCVALAGCDSATYVEGVVRWDSPDRSYGVEYVVPPWEVVSDDDSGLQLKVAAELFGVSLQGSPPTHVFTIGPVDPSTSLLDLLPGSLLDVGTTTSFELDTVGLPDAGADTGADGGIDSGVGALLDVDLGVPQAVALVELDLLVTEQQADLVQELGQRGGADAPWTYEVVVPPGLFVRGYYYAAGDRTIRAMFASLFTLDDGDVDRMAQTITVGSP
jgi:hypothetical protein